MARHVRAQAFEHAVLDPAVPRRRGGDFAINGIHGTHPRPRSVGLDIVRHSCDDAAVFRKQSLAIFLSHVPHLCEASRSRLVPCCRSLQVVSWDDQLPDPKSNTINLAGSTFHNEGGMDDSVSLNAAMSFCDSPSGSA